MSRWCWFESKLKSFFKDIKGKSMSGNASQCHRTLQVRYPKQSCLFHSLLHRDAVLLQYPIHGSASSISLLAMYNSYPSKFMISCSMSCISLSSCSQATFSVIGCDRKSRSVSSRAWSFSVTWRIHSDGQQSAALRLSVAGTCLAIYSFKEPNNFTLQVVQKAGAVETPFRSEDIDNRTQQPHCSPHCLECLDLLQHITVLHLE